MMKRLLRPLFSMLGFVFIVSLLAGCAGKTPAPLPQFSAESEEISENKILFSAETVDGHYLLYITNVDGVNLTKLLDIEVGEIGEERHQVCATLSPDRSRLVFFSLDNYLSVVRIEDREVMRLAKAPQVPEKGELVTGYITWSPDGSKIAHTSNRSLYVVNSDSSSNKKLAEPNTAEWKGEIIEDQLKT